jgi:cell division protein FtsB
MFKNKKQDIDDLKHEIKRLSDENISLERNVKILFNYADYFDAIVEFMGVEFETIAASGEKIKAIKKKK